MSRRSPAALPSGRTTETTGDGGTCDASFIPTAIRRLRSTGCGASSAPRARMLCSMVRFLGALRTDRKGKERVYGKKIRAWRRAVLPSLPWVSVFFLSFWHESKNRTGGA